MPRTIAQIINDLVSSLSTRRPDITAASQSGTVVRDVVIDSPAEEFANVYANQEEIKKLQSTAFATDIAPERLNDLAANYDLTRRSATPASGTVIFSVGDFGSPGEGYTDIIIPSGAEVSAPPTEGRGRINFNTTTTVTMSANNYGSYLNVATGNYEIEAPIEATSLGTETNVGSNQIREIISAPGEVIAVRNPESLTGGSNAEGNESLASRIQERLSGNNKGTKSGYKNTVDENTGVIDSLIIGPNDEEMERDQFGGSVDVLIVGISTGTQTLEYEYDGLGYKTLPRQPVVAVFSVTGFIDDEGEPVETELVEGTDYHIEWDTGVYRNSARAATKVVFDTELVSGIENTSTPVTINYSFNQLIRSLQSEIDEDGNHIIGADVLIKEATQITVDVEFDITVYSGYTLSTVIDDIKANITLQLSNMKLGSSLDKSDVVDWAYNASEGVKSVDLSSLTFTVDGDPIANESVEATKTEYIRLGTLLINGT